MHGCHIWQISFQNSLRFRTSGQPFACTPCPPAVSLGGRTPNPHHKGGRLHCRPSGDIPGKFTASVSVLYSCLHHWEAGVWGLKSRGRSRGRDNGSIRTPRRSHRITLARVRIVSYRIARINHHRRASRGTGQEIPDHSYRSRHGRGALYASPASDLPLHLRLDVRQGLPALLSGGHEPIRIQQPQCGPHPRQGDGEEGVAPLVG